MTTRDLQIFIGGGVVGALVGFLIARLHRLDPEDRPPVVVSNGSSVDIMAMKSEQDEKVAPGQLKKRHKGSWKDRGELKGASGKYMHVPDEPVPLGHMQVNLSGTTHDGAWDLDSNGSLVLHLSTGGDMTFKVEGGGLTFTGGGEKLVPKARHHLKIEGATRVERVSLDGGSTWLALDLQQGWVEVRSRQ